MPQARRFDISPSQAKSKYISTHIHIHIIEIESVYHMMLRRHRRAATREAELGEAHEVARSAVLLLPALLFRIWG